MGRQVVVPAGNLRIPLQVFGTVWDRAEGRFVAAGSPELRRYLGAVVLTCRWVARETQAAPLSGDDDPASPGRMREELHAAAFIAYSPARAGQPVHADWALGVLQTLAWVLGDREHPPIRA